MILSSLTGQLGDKVRLKSPLATFSNTTLLNFLYSLLGSSNDTQVSLQVLLYSPLSVLQLQTLIATSDDIQVVGWNSASLCLPNGTYYIVFEATHGQPYITNVVVDSVATMDGPCNLTVSDTQQILEGM